MPPCNLVFLTFIFMLLFQIAFVARAKFAKRQSLIAIWPMVGSLIEARQSTLCRNVPSAESKLKLSKHHCFYHSTHFCFPSFPFHCIGPEPSTWPKNNGLLIRITVRQRLSCNNILLMLSCVHVREKCGQLSFQICRTERLICLLDASSQSKHREGETKEKMEGIQKRQRKFPSNIFSQYLKEREFYENWLVAFH